MKNNKFIYFILNLVLAFILIILICYSYTKLYGSTSLLNYTIIIASFIATLTALIWYLMYKNGFETFLNFLCIFFFNLLLIYIFPLTINRSLSTFIYFYAEQNGSIRKDFYEVKYFENFAKRRINDGVTFGFLSCDNVYCKTTLKGKIFFNIMYTMGKFTKSLEHYEEFKDSQR